MSYKLYGREVFEANVNGKKVTFTCYSQDTNYGFRHIVTKGWNDCQEASQVKNCIVAKSCYYNRTWERFRYESVLKAAIEKYAGTEEEKKILTDVMIEKKNQNESDKVKEICSAFKYLHDNLSETGKKIMAQFTINSMEDVHLAMVAMAGMQGA